MAGVTGVANRLPACGPDFPNSLIDGGTNALLTGPTVDFTKELVRMHLASAAIRAVPADGDYTRQTIEAERVDLMAALRKSGAQEADAQAIAAKQIQERGKLESFTKAYAEWSASGETEYDISAGKYLHHPPTTPPPSYPAIQVVAGMPVEFGDYMDGVIGWDNPWLTNKDICRQVWEGLLDRPVAERQYKSVAAAYMLGKSWETDDPDKALDYYRQVSRLAKQGLADPTGLAAASLGQEARIYLKQAKYHEAIQLYLEQLAAGDDSAANSLSFAAAKALAQADALTLQQLAADPKDQRVITAYVASHNRWAWEDFDEVMSGPIDPKGKKWLEAMESAGVQDAESAEKLAVEAYRAGDFESAQRWVNRAADSPTAQWVQVKLWLLAGKVDQAAALLARLSTKFPAASSGTNAPAALEDDLVIPGSSYASEDEDIPAANEVRAEMGMVRLGRREYVESLDTLLRSGYWRDAAYVAERVLAVEELKSYVDANWPESSVTSGLYTNEDGTVERLESRGDNGQDIRYLLARRLTRLGQMADAREYYPIQWRAPLDSLQQALDEGHDTTLTTKSRFDALIAAAMITRTNGMELMGTEVEPDWHIWNGQYAMNDTISWRDGGYFPASDDERQRVVQHYGNLERRFHYRAKANALKVEAAQLGWELVPGMPDNSDETARFLCQAGTWLIGRDPKLMNEYYQAILQRCRNTAIGAEAARTGQFPRLDDAGQIIPRRSKGEDTPQAGKFYEIHAGDTLNQIAEFVSQAGTALTVEDILQVNPKVTSPDKIKAGQVIWLPGDGRLEPPDQSTNEAATSESPASGDTMPSTPPNAEEQNNTPRPIDGAEYEVQEGDSLAWIAFRAKVHQSDLIQANPALDPNRLKIGDVILIPRN